MNPLALVIGAAALGGLALAMKSESKAAPKPTDSTAPGGFPVSNTIDVNKILTQVFNDASGKLTPDQVERIRVVFQNLGTDGNGKITTQPALWAKEAALALADELDAEGVPAGVGGTIRTVALGAMALPAGPPSYETPNVSGPWDHLGSFSRAECGDFGDWWKSFAEKWARNWWRR